MSKKTQQLNYLVNSPQLDFIMEAHNALSAKIVEQAGFKGIWASSLAISSALGLRDLNEASWSEVLDVCETMAEATEIPILVDGDSGHGSFLNVQRFVKKLAQRGLAGVCIEDQLFPKANSFLDTDHELIASEFMCGKLKAARDAAGDDNFVIVARTESFIAGRGVQEALARAEAYQAAGADAILVHSKSKQCNEIELFMKEWGDRHPIVIVPTTYYQTPTEHFCDLGINLVIWANHMLRSSIKAMQVCCKEIFQKQSVATVNKQITSVSEIFSLLDYELVKENDKKYHSMQNDIEDNP